MQREVPQLGSVDKEVFSNANLSSSRERFPIRAFTVQYLFVKSEIRNVPLHWFPGCKHMLIFFFPFLAPSAFGYRLIVERYYNF